jgi:hypothetical protein
MDPPRPRVLPLNGGDFGRASKCISGTDTAACYDKLRIVRRQNTHAKILIFGDQPVDHDQLQLALIQRRPKSDVPHGEGTLVQIKSEVDKAFARCMDVIDADGVDPRERV